MNFPINPGMSFPQAPAHNAFSNDQQLVNKFSRLDGIEDRVIYHLLSPIGKTEEELKQVHRLWRCLCYTGTDALLKPLPKFEEVMKLMSNGQQNQDDKRIFRSPYMDDARKDESALLKVYIDSLIPRDLYSCQVNMGVEVISHNKIINLTVPDDEQDLIAEYDGYKITVETKSRITVMLRAVLSLLNGADVQGVGIMQFNYESFMYNEARYALWNNRNFEGQKIVIGCLVGGVG